MEEFFGLENGLVLLFDFTKLLDAVLEDADFLTKAWARLEGNSG